MPFSSSSPPIPPPDQSVDTDARERALAATGDVALVRYLEKWGEKLATLQRRYPERWRVPGWSIGEVRDALTLRLVEVVRGPVKVDSAFGETEMLRLLKREVSAIRQRCRLGATPTDFSEASVLEREPNHEARYLELEDEARLRLAEQRARAQLNRPQRRWLAAMQWAAVCGEFFDSSDRLNLSAASRVLGKNRSSAQRAYRELQQQFQKERERLE
jgi:hypothetical protein